jgi:hypothetical protein
MAITRTVRRVEVYIDTNINDVVSVGLRCRCAFDADPDNPSMTPPAQEHEHQWDYADLTDDEQAAVGVLVDVMTSRMDADHPINAGT